MPSMSCGPCAASAEAAGRRPGCAIDTATRVTATATLPDRVPWGAVNCN